MTLDVMPDAYVLEATEGEALWFAGALVTYKTTGTETNGGLTVADVRAPKGADSPRHRHQHEDEAWYIVSGELTFWLGDDVRTVGAGTFVFGPRQVEHRFRVESEEAHFLLLLTPAGFEDFTRACGWPAATRTMPPAELPERPVAALRDAARRHRIDLVPESDPESRTKTQGVTP